MDNSEGGYSVRKYWTELDFAEALDTVLRALGKQDEKYLLHMLILSLSGHEVELIRVMSRAFPELGKRLPRFFQQRVEDYRRALRMKKVLWFTSSGSVEDEAVRRAWEDTRAMIEQMSMLQDVTLRGLVEDHRAMLRRLCQALVELVMERSGGTIELDHEVLEEFLEGGVR